MLVGMASEISNKDTYQCVNHSRHNRVKGAKANVHNNQILVHTLSHHDGTLDSILHQMIHTLICVFFLLVLLVIPTNITFKNVFIFCLFTFLVLALAIIVSSLVDLKRYSWIYQATARFERAAVLIVFSGCRHGPTNQKQCQ